MRARTWHFYLSGAIGGFVGFFLMEIVRAIVPTSLPMMSESWAEIFALACQFSVFGLAVGAALGLTEGLLQKKLGRMLYGLLVGGFLGIIGGFMGGGIGQAIFGLLPVPEAPETGGSDLAIVLDASSSMGGTQFLFWNFGGNDPEGLRKEAAGRLVDLLGSRDRVAVVDFSDNARTLQSLTLLDSKAARKTVHRAIDHVADNRGGTNLSAGLSAGIEQLSSPQTPAPGNRVDLDQQVERGRHLIFLTDGVGHFQGQDIRRAVEHGIVIHTIGLGSGINRGLLEKQIAKPTGGGYYPVADAEKLWGTFETILNESIRVDMASHASGASGSPHLRRILRIVSWGVLGLMIGLGQGVRENTREDLWVCSLGGALGGLMGGAVFEPVSGILQLGSGAFGRMVADVVVGACIGGSMRLAQGYLVERRAQPTTTLLEILPRRSTGLVAPKPRPGGHLSPQPTSGLRGLVLKMKHSVEASEAAPTASNPRQPSPAPPASTPSAAASESAAPSPQGRRSRCVSTRVATLEPAPTPWRWPFNRAIIRSKKSPIISEFRQAAWSRRSPNIIP